MPIKYALFITRLSVVVFLTPWVLMRFVASDSAKGIASKYYKISNMSDAVNTGVGILWVALLIAFLAGYQKRISYGLVLVFHTIGTAFTIPYLIPGTEKFNILFIAALPTISAMLLLYTLRERDTFLSLN